MRSRTYDGMLFVTPWISGRRWNLSAQCDHAEMHRNRVRYHLTSAGINKWEVRR